MPEEEVCLDEVLADPGDTLCYLNDFGDSWEHVIRLEAVAPRDDTVPAAVCLDGRRDGPSEDSGGPGGYELISAAIDPLNPDHSASRWQPSGPAIQRRSSRGHWRASAGHWLTERR